MERERERAVSGSGRYYRKPVGGRVRTTFLFSQNTLVENAAFSFALSSPSKELGRSRPILNAVHRSSLTTRTTIKNTIQAKSCQCYKQALFINSLACAEQNSQNSCYHHYYHYY